ncbi:amidohydrolase [Specibacter cremeus]|uniref:amidohydrolase n=1 Tax=Specibacter cremeus TaxID=1629051 RepID=UPI00197B8872|nr:amidohydrolase [Specibacter cremeus]
MTLTVFHSGTHAAAPAGVTSALAVRDGRIIALGDDAHALCPAADQLVDLGGGHLGPAFGDGHAHPLFGGLEDDGPQVRACRSVEAIVACVREWAAAHPDAAWIIGASYDSTLAADGLFDAAWLDAVVPDRPVVLRAMDYHTVWANSAALAAAGITAATPEPALGRIVRRADGSPLGTLQEPGAVDLVMDHAPAIADAVRAAALGRATARFAAAGVTWVQDAWVETADLGPYLLAAGRGLLNARLNLAFRADPLRWRGQLAGFAAARERVRELDSPMLGARTVKFFVDGVIESGTAAMLEPYCDTPGDTGLANWDAESLNAAAIEVDRRGFQLHLHAIGDRAVRLALDAIAAVQAVNGPADRRPVIAHLQVVNPADLERFAALGVIANFEPLWAQPDDLMNHLTLPRLGKLRAHQQYPIGTLIRAGVTVSFGSDWPVTHHHPLNGLATAITRSTPDGLPSGGWVPAERIDVADALHAYTAGVAAQAFADHDRGTLAVGLAADLVWLSADPRGLDARSLPDVRVLGTWLEGRRTHAAEPALLAATT